jgi:5-formyltetrahydrofolate cyclo-ligase
MEPAAKALRSALRRRRASLEPGEIAAASLRIARHLWRLPELSRCSRIACYFAVGGEVDCSAFVEAALARRRFVYLPVLHGPKLQFAPYDPAGSMVCNRFGIPEPVGGGRRLRGSELDVVLAPLVAFDDAGHRLGMGAGYYDQTFAFLSRRNAWPRPHFIGLAYEFQRAEGLPARRWDVPLHAVVTERGAHRF